MPKIGRFFYPRMNIDEAIEVAEAIIGAFNADEAKQLSRDPERLREYVDSYGRGQLGDLRAYGLVKFVDKKFELSQLGRRLIGERAPKEKLPAIAEAIQNVALFQTLIFAGATASRDDEEMTQVLAGVAGVTSREAAEHVRAIKNALAYLSEANIPEDVRAQLITSAGARGTAVASGDRASTKTNVLQFRAGATVKEFPFTPEGVGVMLRELTEPSFVEFLRSEAKRHETSEGISTRKKNVD